MYKPQTEAAHFVDSEELSIEQGEAFGTEESPVNDQEQFIIENFSRITAIGMAVARNAMPDYRHADMQDLAQNAAVRAWQKFEPGAPHALYAWVSRTARNLSIDDHRRRSCRVDEVSIDFHELGTELMLPANTSAEEEIGVTEDIENLVGDILRAAGYNEAKIPDEIRIIALVSQGYKISECAEILGMPIGTVSRRLTYTRKHLRKYEHLFQALMAGEEVEPPIA